MAEAALKSNQERLHYKQWSTNSCHYSKTVHKNSLSGSYIRSNTRIKRYYTRHNSFKNDGRRVEHEDRPHTPSCIRKLTCTSLFVHASGQKMMAQARNVASVKVKTATLFYFVFACYWTVWTQTVNEDY